jgi:hypothetical protein
MLWVVLILLALAVMLILYDLSLSPEERALIRKDRERRQRTQAAEPAPPPPGDDLMAQIERDPAGTLARLGTPADAERLMAQGTDLEALGYRPPSGD